MPSEAIVLVWTAVLIRGGAVAVSVRLLRIGLLLFRAAKKYDNTAK